MIGLGVVGWVVRSVGFVRVTLPKHFGSNPGFGAYETLVVPWFTAICIGLGLVFGSWPWALIPMGLGFFALGFVAMALGRLFGRRSSED